MFTPDQGRLTIVLSMGCLLAVLLLAADGAMGARPKVFKVPAPKKRVDSAPAIRAAIQRAAAAGGGVVQLGAGTFYMMTAERKAYAVWPTKVSNVHVTGVKGKTQIIVTDPHIGFFRWDYCRDSSLSNVIVDYETPPFTQGDIVAVDKRAGTFDLKIDKGFPQLDAGFFNPKKEWGMAMNRAERRPKYIWGDHIWINGWEKVDEDTWRLKCQNRASTRELAVGDSYVQLARQRNHGVFGVWNSSQILMQDIIVHASPGITNGVVMSDAITYRRFQVRFRKGTKRIITSNGDGIHVHGNRRGPVIEDCYFEGICDDGVNLNSHMNAIIKVVGDKQIFVHRLAVNFKKGDKVQIVEPKTGVVKATTFIVALKSFPDNVFALKLKDAVEGMKANPAPPGLLPGEGGGGDADAGRGRGGRGGGRVGRKGVRIKDGDVLYNLSSANAGFIIRGNTFVGHRRHGLLIRSGKGLIEKNTFDRICGPAILIQNGMALEGPVGFDVTIRNNKVIGVSQSRHHGDSDHYGAIMVRTKMVGNKSAPKRGITNIRILNNTIIDPPRYGINVISATNVTISGNTVTATAKSTRFGAGAAVRIDNSAGVVVDKLTVTDPRAGAMKAAVLIRANSGAGEKGVKVDVDSLKVKLPEGAPKVLDMRPAPADE